MNDRDLISAAVVDAIERAVADGRLELSTIPGPELERPREAAHGDWATSIALRSSKAAGLAPRAIAQIIVPELVERLVPAVCSAIDIAGPGFVNFQLANSVLQSVVAEVRDQGSGFGFSDLGHDRRVQVEFVSANPVGPLHVGHGRWAALGDSMARVLAHTGWRVEREFYVNDAGVQMDIFARSVSTRYLELCGHSVEFPEDGYRGAYILDIAQEILDEEGSVWAEADPSTREAHFKEKAYAQVLAHLTRVLHGMGVDFDVWFSERTLHVPDANGANEIDRTIDALRESGHVYDAEGAVWFRSTDFGDDKDRVLKKSDGEYTYFAADIAYHKDKYDRGFDRVINIWGADHHGYVARMQAAVSALGHAGQLDIVIGQMVNLFRNGEAVRMSKRTGELVTFEELLEEVGADAARYWFLRRSTDQAVDFDIGLAKQQSAENPVYYVQYAHARICSILRKAAGADTADETVDIASAAVKLVRADALLQVLGDEAELGLMRKLAEFGDVVEAASQDLAPHKLTRYAEDLAATFHQFYTLCRVVSEDAELTAARLALVDAARIVLATCLGLLGVSAPERM